MAKYSEGFKRKAVALLTELNKNGKVIIDDTEIGNVRQLCFHLGISSWSLYNWDKIYNPKEAGEDEDTDLDVDSDFFDDKDIEVSIQTLGEKSEEKDMTIKLDNTFWMSIARGLGLKHYRTSEKQLWLMVGMELVKRSGLVDNDKIKRQLKQNGDNL